MASPELINAGKKIGNFEKFEVIFENLYELDTRTLTLYASIGLVHVFCLARIS